MSPILTVKIQQCVMNLMSVLPSIQVEILAPRISGGRALGRMEPSWMGLQRATESSHPLLSLEAHMEKQAACNPGDGPHPSLTLLTRSCSSEVTLPPAPCHSSWSSLKTRSSKPLLCKALPFTKDLHTVIQTFTPNSLSQKATMYIQNAFIYLPL